MDAGLQPLQRGLVVGAALGQHNRDGTDGTVGRAHSGAEGLVPRHPAPAARLQRPDAAHTCCFVTSSTLPCENKPVLYTDHMCRALAY